MKDEGMITPIDVGGQPCYVIPIHSKVLDMMLRDETRRNYYHKRHVERWEKRHGREYPYAKPEYGTLHGVVWREG